MEVWLVGKVVFRRYELLDPPNEFGDRTQIDIGFDHFELVNGFEVVFTDELGGTRKEVLLNSSAFHCRTFNFRSETTPARHFFHLRCKVLARGDYSAGITVVVDCPVC